MCSFDVGSSIDYLETDRLINQVIQVLHVLLAPVTGWLQDTDLDRTLVHLVFVLPLLHILGHSQLAMLRGIDGSLLNH